MNDRPSQLWPSTHNWFAEIDARADFSLAVDEPMDDWSPTVDQLQVAWEAVAAHGATPLLSIRVVPAQPWGKSVTGEIEAFYVVGTGLGAQLIEELTLILGTSPGRSAAYARNADELLVHAGLPPLPGAEVRSWEWMYG